MSRSTGTMDDAKFEEALNFASRHFGFKGGIRSQQRECLKHFVNGMHIFCSLLTGFGKSFIYQALPMVHDCTCLNMYQISVVSLWYLL